MTTFIIGFVIGFVTPIVVVVLLTMDYAKPKLRKITTVAELGREVNKGEKAPSISDPTLEMYN